jgi:hypothetical protein
VERRYLENYRRWWAALEKVSAVNRRLLRMRVKELADGLDQGAGAGMRK